jgi:adenylosuccinate synthase
MKNIIGEEINLARTIERYTALAEKIRPLMINGVTMINDALDQGTRILVEGAQGTLLDVDYGTYPYVSASNASVHGVSSGCGIPERKIDEVVGIVKAYCTRVGAETGPFPTIERGPAGELIRQRGKEYGTTTGRPRQCGWIDLVATRYATVVNDVDYVVMTLLDVLDVFETIKVCIAYELDGMNITCLPASCAKLMRCKPVYREFRGWRKDITSARKWTDLPQAARDYVAFVEDFIGKPVKIISVGPERTQKVVR